MKEETFWIVRKPELDSKINRYAENPIKTSYELLWAEVKNRDRSTLTLQNTLRRILENYFQILGGINVNELCSYFDGKEKLICRSLCSWVHDGSHNAHDALFVSDVESVVASYLDVFKAIFYKSFGTLRNDDENRQCRGKAQSCDRGRCHGIYLMP